MTDLQDLLALLDRDRVGALVDRYVTTLDEPATFDADWARGIFTEDVRFEHELATLHGVDEVGAAHAVVMARWDHTVHLSTNHVVEVDGDRARLSARLLAIHVHPGDDPPEPLVAANVIDGDAVRTADGWRIGRFAPRTMWRQGTPAAPIGGNG